MNYEQTTQISVIKFWESQLLLSFLDICMVIFLLPFLTNSFNVLHTICHDLRKFYTKIIEHVTSFWKDGFSLIFLHLLFCFLVTHNVIEICLRNNQIINNVTIVMPWAHAVESVLYYCVQVYVRFPCVCHVTMLWNYFFVWSKW